MLEDIKQYLRISHNLDDNMLEGLIKAAHQLIIEKTGTTYKEGDEAYLMLVRFLVAHFYENREAVGQKAMSEMPYSIQHLMVHIATRGEYDQQGQV